MKMNLIQLKTLLVLFIPVLSIVALFTMLELFGRDKKRFDINFLKLVHKINGIFYIALFGIISLLCVYYMMKTGTELSPRGALHLIIAELIFILLFIKILIVKYYQLLFNTAKIFGFSIVMLSFLLFGSSGGFMLIKNKGFSLQTKALYENSAKEQQKIVSFRTDATSINKGKDIFNSSCTFCHAINKNEASNCPNLFNLTKKQQLQVIKKTPTPENIISQLKNPFKNMPSFDHLSDDEVMCLLAYLNTI